MSTAVIEEAKLPRTWRVDARRKFVEYRRTVEAGVDTPEDRELMHAYHQLGMGHTVLSVNKAMQSAGVDSRGYPVLAITNAAARWVFFFHNAGERLDVDENWEHSVSAFVSDHSMNPEWPSASCYRETKTGTFRFPRAYYPISLSAPLRARVPLVPPSVRPKASLDKYVILWEADWKTAPRDPYLLRRLTQDLFVVLAQWDLTEVERTVLEMATVGAYRTGN